MKSANYQFVILNIFAFAVILSLSCGIIGGPPANPQIAAATDSTIQLVWTAPAEGMPDSFLIYFCPAGETIFALIGDTTGNGFIHDPQGLTGRYQISALFTSKEYKSTTILSTVPVYTGPDSLAELDGIGNAGFGWDRESGSGKTYSIRRKENALKVDFYITDFTTGSTLPFHIASPHMGPSDPSGVVPTDSWQKNGFTNPLSEENSPLPSAAGTTDTFYFNYTAIPSTLPALIGCYTIADQHYALIKVTRVNTANSTVILETWFQLIPNLRLIYHPPTQ
ncbi:MAG: fibronectin type III domain-containing protein [bacterium]